MVKKCVSAGLCLVMVCSTIVWSAPADLKLTKGRIALSHAGNNYDKDVSYSFAMDWAAIAAFGMQKRFVHVHHSVCLSNNDPLFRKEMVKSAEGWKYFPGFDSSVVFDAWVDIHKTVAHFKAQADMSTADDKLYFCLAGPVHVPYLCIQATAKEKRMFIHCISHFSELLARSGVVDEKTEFHIKQTFYPDGLVFEDIRDYNATLGGAGHDRWSFLDTAMTVKEGIPPEAWQWVLSRDWKGNGDCSQSGNIWYVLTGKTEARSSPDFEERFKNPLPMLPPMGQVSIAPHSGNATGFSGIPMMEISLSQKNKVLDVKVNGMKGNGSVAVYNLQSRQVGKGALMNGKAQLTLDRGTRGSYVMTAESQGQKISKRIMIK